MRVAGEVELLLLLCELMCLESDSNRHYAVFETALSTVGVPRLEEQL